MTYELYCRVWISDEDYLDLTEVEWVIFDKRLLNRKNGPAVKFVNGGEQWRTNGRFHRIGGPALVYSDGTKMWWVNRKLHRTDGPAIIYPQRHGEWWIDDQELDRTHVEKWIQENEIDLSTQEGQTAFLLKWS